MEQVMEQPTMLKLIDRYGRNQVFVIAEAGTAHAGELAQAKELIQAASEAGASAIKFQIVFADEILHPQSGELLLVGKRVNLYQKFKALERNEDFFRTLKQTAEKYGILFLASAFGSRSVALLRALAVEAYKLASPELNFYELWQMVLATPAPILFSTGMSQQRDLYNLIRFLNTNSPTPSPLQDRLALLQCITCYPSRLEDYNLLTLHAWTRLTGWMTGLSDHTEDPITLPRLALWLKLLDEEPFILEKHFTLDKAGPGLDDAIALTPGMLKELINELQSIAHHITIEQHTSTAITAYREWAEHHKSLVIKPSEAPYPLRVKNYLKQCKTLILNVLKTELPEKTYNHAQLEASLGTGWKTLAPCEAPYYQTTRRSLVATEDIDRGECLSVTNSAFLRAEQGNEAGLSPDWEETVRLETGQGREQFCSLAPIKSGRGITLAKIEQVSSS